MSNRFSASNIDPSEWAEVLVFHYNVEVDGWPVPAYNLEALIALRQANPGRFFQHENGGCAICGARFKYGSVFRNEQTGDHIVVGWICAEKLELTSDLAAHRMVKERAFAAQRRTLRRRELFRWAQANRDLLPLLRVDHGITRDIRRQVIARPERGLTGPQIDLLQRLKQQVAEKEKRDQEPKVPAPEGRHTIEGELVSAKHVDSDYGVQTKMVVKIQQPEGSWVAYGTMPSILEDTLWERGIMFDQLREKQLHVRFTATFKRSNREEHFAFAKRPTKAELLS